MKVLILAYDGLEYNLVKRWKLRNLLQVKYGKYKAHISEKYKEPYTPEAWITIITGTTNHNIKEWWVYNNSLEKLRYKPPFKWIRGKRKFLKLIGIKPRLPNKNDLKIKTIFDLTKKPIPLFIPGYNEPTEPHYRLKKAFEKGLEEYIKTIWQIHYWRKWEFFNILDKEWWDLFMCWFDLADLLGHIFIAKNRMELYKGYVELDKIAMNVKDSIDKNTLLLILSDHGMKAMPDGTGDHSFHGFWSINKNLEWFNPKKATDFYNLIKKSLQ